MTNFMSVHVVVLGSKQAGKTAVIVRFLTKRYIGEYKSNIDWLYKHSVTFDDMVSNVEILDVSRWPNDSMPEEEVRWADACLVIYSICDRDSFNKAHDSLDLVHRLRAPGYVPIVLVGNKKDLEHCRQVSYEDGSELASQYGCKFYEVSAADSFVEVSTAFQNLIREARTLHLQRSLPRQRKLSIVSMSKMFGAMFGKTSPKVVVKDKRPSFSL
ncbi:ras-related and estrogen-regulated growth inhibitor-like isoform X1 [Limulus polyphemus]|uniref:small monomeric GTPase n=1 Tax=Limulus polyphemus TaxID=6850 RepID=A0ABM1BMK6_LIMPO|nr:ras-related and estrogen-regulated growth inhibitor-like isoform X1 [Limulus polyphemus]